MYILTIAVLAFACNSKIKDDKAKVLIEKGTELVEGNEKDENVERTPLVKNDAFLGYWVGYFKEDNQGVYSEKGIAADEGFYWNRDNKINISIDESTDSLVTGHSVVAGNHRPFSGVVHNGVFVVKEPGDDQYDGVFTFEIVDNALIGKWSAYKDIDIRHRTYTLEKKTFVYNADTMLHESQKYIDWGTFTEQEENFEIEEDEYEVWVRREFASATDLIYTINASNTVLKKKDVENLKKGDITIIRNTIYARHGYSFKNRPLRVFFDAQRWYIPVHTDIKADFTEIEKGNIQLLLRYEKNAAEYYDYFGRG